MRRPRRLTTSRVGNDRGAVAVIVALLMVVFLGFAAIAIDVGRLYVERRQLQNGADAAALAIAQDCAGLLTQAACGIERLNLTANNGTVAGKIASQNANDQQANARTVTSSLDAYGGGSVTVQTSTLEADGKTTALPYFFAPGSKTVAATSTANWGTPSAGVPALPFAIDICQLPGSIAQDTLNDLTSRLNQTGADLSGLIDSSRETTLRYDNGAGDQTASLLGMLTASFLGPLTLKPAKTITNTLCNTRAAISAVVNPLPLPVRSAYGGFVFLQPNPDPGGCQVQIGDLLTNLLKDPINVRPVRKLPTACAPNLTKLIGQTLIVPIYVLAGNKSTDLLTPGNIVPDLALTDVLTGLGNGTGLVGSTLCGVNLLANVLAGIKLLPTGCNPPQPDWVHVVAFAGFTLDGYNIDAGDTPTSTKNYQGGDLGDLTKCAPNCRGLNGSFTQIVSLNTLNLGPLSVDLTARVGLPAAVDLNTKIGPSVGLGVKAVVLGSNPPGSGS